MNKIKIFLAYHKDTPIFKSDIFEPIQVGSVLSDKKLNMLQDDSGDNISFLNKYYCELTGHYWVLKNYIDDSADDYIGFAHYRRLIDFENITKDDIPSIFGISLSEAQEFFSNLDSKEMSKICGDYDILLPSTVYMYEETVNPILRDGENLNMYNHFKTEHKNDLIDVLKGVIKSCYPEYLNAVEICFSSKKAYFFNMYVMKKDILKSYLTWEFGILSKLGETIGGWENTEYYRMAGFIGELLINIWLKKNNNYKIGHFPILMVDFEFDYLKKVDEYIKNNDYNSAINELVKLLNYSSNKFAVYTSIYELCLKSDNKDSDVYLKKALDNAKDAEDYYNLAVVSQKYSTNNEITTYLYKKAIEIEPDSRYYADCLLYYSESIHDLETTKYAWEILNKNGLNQEELRNYEHFQKIYKKVNSK